MLLNLQSEKVDKAKIRAQARIARRKSVMKKLDTIREMSQESALDQEPDYYSKNIKLMPQILKDLEVEQ